MIVIYTQEESIIRNNADEATADLIEVYGEKFGTEAYNALNRAPIGASYRMPGV